MATVTGNVRNITGSTMNPLDVVLIFTLNATNIIAGSGGLRPDNSTEVTPESDGSFSVNLESTSNMLLNAWYRVRIEWRGPAGTERPKTLRGYLEAIIRVPAGGGRIDELIDVSGPPGGGGSGPNAKIWWVGLTSPPSRRFLWLHTDPNDYDNPASTGDVREWR